MKLRRVFLTMALVFLSLKIVLACSCAGVAPFCLFLNEESKIYQVEIINEYSGGSRMDVKILDQLYGVDTLSFDSLTIAEKPTSCQISNTIFSVGDTLIVTFKKLNTSSSANFPSLWFGQCGIDYLFQKGDYIFAMDWLTTTYPGFGGGIILGVSSMNYQVFQNEINKICDYSIGLFNCDSYITPFCENVTDNSRIVEVEVLNQYDLFGFMDVKITDYLQGVSPLQFDTLTIVDLETEECSFPNVFFNIGDRYVLVFDDSDLINVDAANHFGLRLNRNRITYLKVVEDKLIPVPTSVSWNIEYPNSAMIAMDVDTLDYQQFKDDPSDFCTLLNPVAVNEIDYLSERYWNVLPNPTSDKIQIETDFSGEINYQLYDVSGQLMQEGKIFQQNNYEIEMSHLSQGIYFLQIQSEDFFGSKKVVKM